MKRYFSITFETDKSAIWSCIADRIDSHIPGYLVVCDGNIMSMVQRDKEYRDVVDNAMFAIMDSAWIPLFVRMKYGDSCTQYCGSDIFKDITEMKKYRQYYLGSTLEVLEGLKGRMSLIDENISKMKFEPLPFCSVDDFDYFGIASKINADSPDIVWLSLGAPKQEQFAMKLLPYLDRGVIIPIGAVFNFRSGISIRRAPRWMVKCRLEFVFRLFFEPRKQIKRCWRIITTLPLILNKDGDSC